MKPPVLLRVLALVFLLISLGPVETSSPMQARRPFFVGVDEDAPKWGRANAVATLSRALGVKAVRVSVPWHEGASKLTIGDRRTLDALVVRLKHLRIVAAVYGDADAAPQDEEARAEFCDFTVDLVTRYRSIRDVVIWNEPNSASFWRPQFSQDGTSVAPAAYEALLARCWSELHAAAPGVNVIAPSAPRGNRVERGRPGASHAPGLWYRKLGTAYRASGRRKPILDTIGHNPYPDFTSERPWTRHPASDSIGQGDYDKLVSALDAAFRGTGQPRPGQGRVTIWYLEQGFQTRPEPTKEHLYAGSESDRFALPAWSPRAGSRTGLAPDQATQLADSIRLAYCQPGVGAYFNFLLADERELEGWQSGVLWSDWTPKPSYAAFAEAVGEVNEGAVDCRLLDEVRGLASPSEVPPPIAIGGVRTTFAAPFSATVSWRTSLPSATRLEGGLLGAEPTIWQVAEGERVVHSVTLSGLAPSRSYRFWVSAVGPDGQQAQSAVTARTPRLPHAPQATVARGTGALLLDGGPFFPFMVWGQCPEDYAQSLAGGITLFAQNPCGNLREQLSALGGRALSAAVAEEPGAEGPGLIGYFHPDEADGRGLTAATLPDPPEGSEDGVRFLTLTNHFYSGVEPLGWGREMYPGLIAASDMVGFDLYPLQEFCRPELLSHVHAAQQELVRLAQGRPTFQWIEAADWRCPGGSTAVTPATVRAESWLAIAGGARGLGFFPAAWGESVGVSIAQIARDVARLGPALYGHPVPATVTAGEESVMVGARRAGDALYVFAVNASREPVEATLRLPGLEGRPLALLNELRSVAADGDTFSDRFGPLAVHVYLVAPPDFTSVAP